MLDIHGKDLKDVAVVLPSRRAGLYLQRELASAAKGALWSPRMHTMSTFMEQLTGIRMASPMQSLLQLYALHRDLKGGKADELSRFLQWAPAMLRDMSEVDAHLLPLQDIYADLRAVQEIEAWSLAALEHSPGQKRLLTYWSDVAVLHERHASIQEQQSLGTMGHVARKAAMAVKDSAALQEWKRVWFVGLNALVPSQLEVVRAFQREGRADVAWDGDRHYIDDERQEAGRYLRKHKAVLGEGRIPPTDLLQSAPREIHLNGQPDKAAMVFEACRLLDQLEPEELGCTVVVLADNSLLGLFLNALPDRLENINVTMGMPLYQLPVNGTVQAFQRLHQHAQQWKSIRTSDLERLLLDPFLRMEEHSLGIVRDLRQKGAHLVPYAHLPEVLGTFPEAVRGPAIRALSPIQDPLRDLSSATDALWTWAWMTTKDKPLEREQVHRARLAAAQLHELLAPWSQQLDLAALFKLHMRSMRETQLDLFGEPLRGVQVMGVLETRALDHERVIIIGASEGTLPPKQTAQSFIPFDLRRMKGLPLPSDGDAISAYHFYRSLQRARHVHLLYSAGGEAAAPSSPTRFVAQIKEELASSTGTTLTSTLVQPFLQDRTKGVIAVQKDAEVARLLCALLEKGISPSKLGHYLRCPLGFHLEHVLRFRPTEQIGTGIPGNVLGTIVHEALEKCYTPFLGQQLLPEAIRQATRDLHAQVMDIAKEALPGHDLDHGQVSLQLEMAATAAHRFMQHDADRVEEQVTLLHELEEELEATLPINVHGFDLKVRFTGRMDRTELRDGVLHILDLKTGRVESRDLQLKDMAPERIGPERNYALQLLCYAWMYMEKHPDVSVVRAGVLPLQRTTSGGVLQLRVGDSHDITRQDLPAIRALLSAILTDMLDPDKPFQHAEGSTYCSMCEM